MDRFADGAEDRPHALKHLGLATHQNPQSARRCFIAAAKYRNIQELDTFLGIRHRLPSTRFRMYRRQVEHNLPSADRRPDAAGSENDCVDRTVVAKAVHDHLGIFHAGSDIGRGLGAHLQQRFALISIAAPDGQLITAPQQRGCHSATHDPQANECDSFHVISPCLN